MTFDIHIIGGGLAGISAGRTLGRDAHLVEAAERLGGLARTDVVDGFWFDWTGHWLHLRTPVGTPVRVLNRSRQT